MPRVPEREHEIGAAADEEAATARTTSCRGGSSGEVYPDLSLFPPSILLEVPPAGQTHPEARAQETLAPSPGIGQGGQKVGLRSGWVRSGANNVTNQHKRTSFAPTRESYFRGHFPSQFSSVPLKKVSRRKGSPRLDLKTFGNPRTNPPPWCKLL